MVRITGAGTDTAAQAAAAQALAEAAAAQATAAAAIPAPESASEGDALVYTANAWGAGTLSGRDSSANTLLHALRYNRSEALSMQRLARGLVDTYQDETGINAIASSGHNFDATNHRYCTNQGTDDYNVLLLHMDGPEGAQVFTDECGKTITANGNAHTTTTDMVFGSAAGSFDGTGDYLSAPANADFDFGAESFTVDLRLKTVDAKFGIYSYYKDADNQLYIFQEIDGRMYAYMYTDGVADYSVSWPWTPNGYWQHLAFVYDASLGIMRFFADGVNQGDKVITPVRMLGASALLYIGHYGGDGTYDYTGLMDEYRVSKGAVRFWENFTPPANSYASGDADMTLVSVSRSLDIIPSSMSFAVLIEPIGPPNLNTNIVASVTRDGGSTWTDCTLVDYGLVDATKHLYYAEGTSVAAQPSGSSIAYKLVTDDEQINLYGVALLAQA